MENIHPDTKEAIPPNVPKPRSNEVDLRLFVESDHAEDTVTRRFRSGHFIFVTVACVVWYSKKQNTVETSVFGAKFMSMKIGMESVRGLRYKLRMIGIPLSGTTYTYCDNMSVIHNTQRLESTLNKRINSIAYHAMMEYTSMDESLTAHVPALLNPFRSL